MVSVLGFNNYDCICNRAGISKKLLTDRGQVFVTYKKADAVYYILVDSNCTFYNRPYMQCLFIEIYWKNSLGVVLHKSLPRLLCKSRIDIKRSSERKDTYDFQLKF